MNPRCLLFVVAMTLAATTVPAAEPIKSLKAPYPSHGQVERLDPAFDLLLAPDAGMELLAEGFNWAEGPVWMPQERQLVFSDVPENIVYRWREGQGVDVFLTPSGFTGDNYDGRERGSNGLTIDAQGRLVLCQHGDRRVARLNPDGRSFTPLAERWEGRRFNSPNDLCFDRAGNLYFTDPPYGMGPSTVREIDHHGVYRVAPDGKVTLLSRDLERPNGIGVSPDGKTLYVANSHRPRPIIMAFPFRTDGTVRTGEVFFDASALLAKGRRGAMDGLRVDAQGNLWATGPGGVLVFSPEGKHLGTLLTGQATANCAFGDADGATLYIMADMFLCRIRTRTKGQGF